MTGWIVGPRYDLLFFSTIWLLPLFVIAPLGSAGVGLGAAFFYVWIYHLLIRFPHFAAMFRTTYLRPEQRAYYRQHWVRYFGVPALILLVYALPLLASAGYASPAGHAVATVAYVWGYQHIGMQNYGILQVYRLRAGADRVAPRFEKAIFYAIIVAVAATNHLVPLVEVAGRADLATSSERAVNTGLVAVLLLLVGGYFTHLWRQGSFSGPALLYFGVALVAMVQWPFYEKLPDGSWFLVFNGHHSVAYLGLLFVIEWNRRSPGESMTFAAGMRGYARFMGPLLLFSLGLVFVTMLYGTAKLAAGYSEQGGSLEVLLGFFVVHYYVESQVWKFRNPHNRRTTLALLHRPGQVSRAGAASVRTSPTATATRPDRSGSGAATIG